MTASAVVTQGTVEELLNEYNVMGIFMDEFRETFLKQMQNTNIKIKRILYSTVRVNKDVLNASLFRAASS